MKANLAAAWQPSAKQRRWLRRILIAASAFVLGLGLPDRSGALHILRLVLLLTAFIVAGYDVLRKAVLGVVHGQIFDENFLMSLATVGALGLGDHAEAAAVMLFYQVGELFQSLAVSRSRRSISELMELRPEEATVIREGVEQTVEPESVEPDELLLVRPGERVPLDCIICEGQTAADTSALTGEALPRAYGPGELLPAGVVNLSAKVLARVSGSYEQSTVARILELVEEATEAKAASESFITRFARWYTPLVTLAALLLALLPPLLAGGDWQTWLGRALIFLVVSCPCALVISVPLSFFGGIGGAARQGVLVKGGNVLEALAKVQTVAWDKTGTLTNGRFRVVEICPQQLSGEQLLALAVRCEADSPHPLAAAIRAAAPEIGISPAEVVRELPGLGVEAQVDGELYWVGNRRLLEQQAGVELPAEADRAGTLVHMARSGCYLGCLVLADELKESSATAVAALRQMRIDQLMLTGDREAAARFTADGLGLPLAFELDPAAKLQTVRQLAEAGQTVAFVGDGVNDAPVLAGADVGIAMGALGSDAAIEAADVVLMDDDPQRVALSLHLARRTLRVVRENIAFALGVKAAVLILGALGLVSIWWAVFADVGVAVLAILNSLRTLRPLDFPGL